MGRRPKDRTLEETFERFRRALVIKQSEAEKGLLEALNYRVERLKAKQKAINELKYDEQVITNDIITFMKDQIYCSTLNKFVGATGQTIWEAWRWFNKNPLEEQTDKDIKWDECKKSFEYISHLMSMYYLIDYKNFKLEEMLLNRFDNSLDLGYVYEPTKRKIKITLPNFQAINADSYIYLLNGFIVRYAEYEHVYGILIQSWDIEKIQKAIDKYVKEGKVQR